MADNLVLGRGKVFFAPYPRGATTGGTKGYFGNTPTMALAQTNTKLDHYSSEGGLKVKDKSIILQTDMTVTFDCDNVSDGNLALWFGGNNTDALPSDAPGDLGAIAIVGRSDTIYGALFFESDNPVGDNKNYWWPYVSLTPNGNYALKGDAWQVMSFTAEALKRDALTQRVYIYSPTSGSTAAADTTAEITVAEVAVVGVVADILTGGTVTAPATVGVLVEFDAGYVMTGGDVGWMVLNDGTVNVGGIIEVHGTAGTAGPFVGTVAHTYTVKIFDNALGTSTAIATSGTVTAS